MAGTQAQRSARLAVFYALLESTDPDMAITSLDHLVLTVADIARTVEFYQRALGFEAVRFKTASGGLRWALRFGQSKINLHLAGQEFEPKAKMPTPGSADLCFLSSSPVSEVMKSLSEAGVELIAGPVPRTGSTGPICSIYFRDPDGNLIEVSNPLNLVASDSV